MTIIVRGSPSAERVVWEGGFIRTENTCLLLETTPVREDQNNEVEAQKKRKTMS